MKSFSAKALSELHDHAENQRWIRQVQGFPLFAGLPHTVDGVLGRWLWKKDSTRQALLENDRVLLSVLQDRGHLKALPLLLDTDRKDKAPSSFSPRLGRPGLVTVCSRLDGSPVEFETVTTPTVSRWFVLLHEVGHQEFQFEPCPFRPSADRGMEPELVEQLNQWSLGPAGMENKGRSILNECFADVYASMVMLSCLEGEVLDMAQAQIRSNQATRWANAQRADALYVKDLEEVSDMGQPLLEHLTGHALDRMWASRESWQHASADQLRQKAFELASDGWLDVMEASRLDAKTGFPLGWSYRWGALPPALEDSLQEAVMELGSAYMNGTHLGKAVEDWKGSNPSFENAMTTVLPALRESFEERFPGTRLAVLNRLAAPNHPPLSIDFSERLGWAKDFVRRMLKAPEEIAGLSSAMADLKQSHAQACVRVFDRFIDQPTHQSDWATAFIVVAVALKEKRQALGLGVELPVSPVAWRQTRAPTVPVAEPLPGPSPRP